MTHADPPDGALSASPAERAEAGRKVRSRLPRSSLGDWVPGPDRRLPLDVLADQETGRVPELVRIRHERMAASPFAFYRGAAAVFSADLATREHSGLVVQLCGDAHLANFGSFASPERIEVFDLNDFDETLPGPFEWDLERLAASFEVAARSNTFDRVERMGIQRHLTRSYCAAMSRFAASGYLQVWYARLALDDVLERWGNQVSAAEAEQFERRIRKARSKDSLKAFDKLTSSVEGQPRFVSDPPLLVRVEELVDPAEHRDTHELIARSLQSYHHTLQPNWRRLLERYRFVDLARKVVGVGSIGTRCWVALLMGRDAQDPLLLQVKEADASVLEPHLGASRWPTHGQRVVEGQRLIQSASDVFLGWERLVGLDGIEHDYYVRQLWDRKGSADLDGMSPRLMAVYAQMCGETLARAHARTGDPVAISAYTGAGKAMAEAMGAFAAAYADQNDRDHAEFVAHATRRADGVPTER
jgi:uncharacterized protein (DUF2252 family)